MDSSTFKSRTKKFALRVIDLTERLPRTRAADIIGRQLIRCATSVGANYRAACCGKSPADFIAKRAIVQEEADESLYWMELLIESRLCPEEQVKPLMNEGREILSMTITSIKTARARNCKT